MLKAISIKRITSFHICLRYLSLSILGPEEEWLHRKVLLYWNCNQWCSHLLRKPCCPTAAAYLYVTGVPSPATVLCGAATVRNHSLCRNNSCLYLCNGCRMTVHILARWSCHKSLILGLSVGPCCQVAFGQLWLDRSRTYHLGRCLIPS